MKNNIETFNKYLLIRYSPSIDCLVKYYKTFKSENKTRTIYQCTENISTKKFKYYTNQYFYSSCNCAHDCCGHWFPNSVNTKRIGKNKFSVIITYAQNY